ncbi:hypothetical protein KJ840_04830 [Patescibacteria group bacterium]|nr:hypothetical protein [Patescibacteria group bacterium]
MNSKLFFSQLFKITKIAVIVLPIIGLFYLVYLDFVPSGHLEFTYDFSQDSPVITNLFPANRMTEINKIVGSGSYWQAVKQDPVYFDVRLPQKFAAAKVKIIYQNKNQPLIQLGLKTIGEGEWHYQFKPLENQLLDNLDWPVIENAEASLWQRSKNFITINQFFDQLDSLDKVGAYYYDLDRKFMLPDYQPQNNYQELNKTLRGGYAFYTYIKNEVLDFTFKTQDINRSEGPDFFTFKVYNGQNDKIYEEEFDDDGYISKLDPASAPRYINLQLADLAEGVYKIQLVAEDEIFTRQIKTKQQYLTFIDRLYLADSREYEGGFVDLIYKPTVIYSTIPRLGFETAHEAGRQSVKINDQTLDISETHKNYFITSEIVPNYIFIPENDLKVFGRGLLAFSQNQFFNPEIFQLRDFSGDLGVDYLITEYHSPQEINGWKAGEVRFNLNNADIENRKLRLVISAPELSGSKEIIPLKQISVTLDKPPLTFNELMSKIFNYLKASF